MICDLASELRRRRMEKEQRSWRENRGSTSASGLRPEGFCAACGRCRPSASTSRTTSPLPSCNARRPMHGNGAHRNEVSPRCGSASSSPSLGWSAMQAERARARARGTNIAKSRTTHGAYEESNADAAYQERREKSPHPQIVEPPGLVWQAQQAFRMPTLLRPSLD